MVASRVNRVRNQNRIRSKSSRADLVFPVARIHRRLKNCQPLQMFRCGVGASVYAAAVLEYLTAEVLELAGNVVRVLKKRRLQPPHVYRAIACDQELHDFLKHVIIPGGGVVPQILQPLIPKAVVTNGRKQGRKSKPKAHPKSPAAPKTSKRSAKKPAAAVADPVPAKPQIPKKPSEKTKPAAPPRQVSVHAGDIVILSEKVLHLGQKLTVVKSDIVKIAADAVVHPTNSSFYSGGHVGQVLVRRGGAEYTNELQMLKNSGSIPACGTAMSKAFGINAKFVIHCNGPTHNDTDGLNDLHKTVQNVFKLAEDHSLTSIALPSIGSGRAGFPKQAAAETILRAIHAYFTSCAASSIKQIYFVLFDKESTDVYVAELGRLAI